MSEERYIPFVDEVVVIHGTVTQDKLTLPYFRYDDEGAVYEAGSSRLVCSIDRLRERPQELTSDQIIMRLSEQEALKICRGMPPEVNREKLLGEVRSAILKVAYEAQRLCKESQERTP